MFAGKDTITITSLKQMIKIPTKRYDKLCPVPLFVRRPGHSDYFSRNRLPAADSSMCAKFLEVFLRLQRHLCL